jgi:hypothetical protein
MKYLFTAAMLVAGLMSFAQWTRVHQFPGPEIFSLLYKDAYGTAWDSTLRIALMNYDNRSSFSTGDSLKTKDEKIQLRVTPNPVQSYLNIYVSGTAGNVDIDLINTMGQVVGRWNNVNPVSIFHTTLSHVPAGVYTVVVVTGGSYVSKKIVVQ